MGDVVSSLNRAQSVQLVLGTVLQSDGISRAHLAKQTGLSKQTISEIIARLEADGWVFETGRTGGHVGRTAVTYKVAPNACVQAIVDLGGTKVMVCLVDFSCKVMATLVEPTETSGGPAVVRQIARLCAELLASQGLRPDQLSQCVVGVPGVPDANSGKVLMVPNIPGLADFNFVRELSDAVGAMVLMENDVNLAALGESWVGSGEGHEAMALISLGTGIGGGIIIDRQLVRGAAGSAGELGFLPFGSDPFEPQSMRQGALERRLGTAGLRARYTELTGEQVSVPTIFERANGDQTEARQVLQEAARLMARVIATLACVVNPKIVVLTGSIGQREEFERLVRPAVKACFPADIEVARSSLEGYAPIHGGMALGLSSFLDRNFNAGVPTNLADLPRPSLSHQLVGKTEEMA
jgi:predicted NBD/HSP70 family sugar kinase/biotin operon repressor